MIKELLRESLEFYKNKSSLYEVVKNSFKDTKLGSNKEFLNESAKLLASNDINRFYKNLYESADLLDALMDICVLTFSAENIKVGGDVATFSLPAGWTCPYAKSCEKLVNRERTIDPEKAGTFKISKKTGEKIPYKGDVVVTKGKEAEFDCYAANMEMQYDAVRANRWRNKDLLDQAGDTKSQAELIVRSLKYFFATEGVKEFVRIHESGDFYNGKYLNAWIMAAKMMPKTHFYAYTKSIPLVKKYKKLIDELPNLALTLSKGGKRDEDLASVDIKESIVFNTPEEVLAYNKENNTNILVDLDDTLAREKGGKEKNFALLVHGTQEPGEMMKNKVRNETFMAYWKYKKKINIFWGKSEDYEWTTEKAQEGVDTIIDIIKNPDKYKKKFSKPDLEFMGKLMRYVVKYNNFNFNPELSSIIPEKFK